MKCPRLWSQDNESCIRNLEVASIGPKEGRERCVGILADDRHEHLLVIRDYIQFEFLIYQGPIPFIRVAVGVQNRRAFSSSF